MSHVTSFLFLRHLRTEPSSHVLYFRDGVQKGSGRGLSFWFRPLGTSISVVPLDDREQAFLLKARAADFQDVHVNGTVTWRVVNAVELASRVDFSIHTRTGAWTREPLDRIAAVVTGLAQQQAATWVSSRRLRDILSEGADALRSTIHQGLVHDAGLAAMGIEIVATGISSVAPTPEMEKALQMPAREAIQQQADEATFARRALAVAKERAIQENELANQVELARREQELIEQRGQNERRRATETVESKRIEAEGTARNARISTEAQAEGIRALEGARVHAEKERMDIYRDLPPATLMGLAARELATKLQNIEHLSLGPDSLGPLLERVLGAQARRLETEREKG